MTTIHTDTRGPDRGATGPVVDLDGAVGGVATLRLLMESVRLRDTALADHCLRSAHLAAAMAQHLGGSEDEIERTYLAGLLHDVGKLGVAEAILWKPAALDPTEWEHVRAHPVFGHRLVADVVHDDVAAAVLHHHERADGDGYPGRVPLGSLPATVAIVQVADAFDALTSDRPYEPAVPTDDALAELDRCAGSQFSPEVVVALREVVGLR